jgi:hypothetical protein
VNDKKAAARDAATDSLHRKYHAEFCVNDQCDNVPENIQNAHETFFSSLNIISHVAVGKIERKSFKLFLSFHSLATLSANFEL